jgi:hypothetical protein
MLPRFLQAGQDSLFPYTVYLVPNALFPLMTYFVWIRLSVYKSYIPLYIAGKSIGGASIIGWFFFSFFSQVSPNFTVPVEAGLFVPGFFVIAMLDGLTILGGAMLVKKLKSPAAETPTSKAPSSEYGGSICE